MYSNKKNIETADASQLTNAVTAKAPRDEPQPCSSAGFTGDLPRGRCPSYFYGLELLGGL